MKLGLLADIHEQVETLRAVLDVLERRQVDQFVVLGDVFEMGSHLRETCEILQDIAAVGVWGNHDFGLCDNPPPDIAETYGEVVVRFMTSLRPRLEIEGCLFQHVEPWLDPSDLQDLWYFEGIPDSPAKIERIFAAMPGRLAFAGHFHRWLLATPSGLTDWSGERPITLAGPERYYVVIGAICEGRFATFDTQSWELCPLQVDA
jgi:hypothetical protein